MPSKFKVKLNFQDNIQLSRNLRSVYIKNAIFMKSI